MLWALSLSKWCSLFWHFLCEFKLAKQNLLFLLEQVLCVCLQVLRKLALFRGNYLIILVNFERLLSAIIHCVQSNCHNYDKICVLNYLVIGSLSFIESC